MTTTQLPGRLGNPDSTFETDSRADPRIVAAVELMGGFGNGVEPIGPNASYEEALAYCTAFEESADAGNEALRAALPDWPHIISRTETIKGVDGNDIKLFIHHPRDQDGPLPCIYHTHGGGMVVMSAEDPGFIRIRNDLASHGHVVVGVEFRNGGGRLGAHPFPAGLNDCASGLQWVHENAKDLGVGKITIAGESGGGNLAIATTMKAKQEGWLDMISGVYAMCPFICGDYASPPAELTSLTENNGYMLDTKQMAALAYVYDPSGDNKNNPMAWPLSAAPQELAGLPPHIISVNELDPLRDEGLAFFRKLLAAGVPAMARTAMGTPHAGDQMFADVVPDAYRDLLGSISGFSKRV